MVKLSINEIAYIHKVISQQDIKGVDAPFIANILGKLVNEATVLEFKIKNETKTKK
jgi:hypothetical protein